MRNKTEDASPGAIALGKGLPDQPRAVLAAAIELFSEKGFHAATTREIAARAGTSPAGAYVHFRSKNEILLAICTAAHEVTDDLLSSALVRPASAERLAHAMGQFARWHAENVQLGRVAQYQLYALDEESRSFINRMRRRSQNRVRSYIDELVAAGAVDAPDVRSLTRGLMSLCIDVCRWYDPAGTLSPRQIASQYADLAYRLVPDIRGGPVLKRREQDQ